MTDPNGSASGGQPGGAAPAGGGAAPWYGADASPETKGFVELKGWDSPGKAIDSYRHLETLLGADKAGRAIVLPKDDKDADGWNGLFAKLGRPEKPDGYKLPVPEGDPGDFAKAFAPILHAAGLSQRQAETLATEWNKYQQGQTADLQAKAELQGKQAGEELKREWGAQYDAKVAMVDRAGVAIGATEDDLNDLRAAMGPKRAMEFMARIGEKLGEDAFVGGGTAPGATSERMSVEAAKVRLGQIMNDQDALTKYMNGDAALRNEVDTLNRVLATTRGPG